MNAMTAYVHPTGITMKTIAAYAYSTRARTLKRLQTWALCGVAALAGLLGAVRALAATQNAATCKADSDWRLPRIVERMTLVKAGNTPAIDSVAFPKPYSGESAYWTASEANTGFAQLYDQGASKHRIARNLVRWLGWAVAVVGSVSTALGGGLIIESSPAVFVVTTNSFTRQFYITNGGTSSVYNVWVDELLGSGLQHASTVVSNMAGVTVSVNQSHSGALINGANIAIAELTAGERRQISATAQFLSCNNLSTTTTANWKVNGVDAQTTVSASATVQVASSSLLNSIVATTPISACGGSATTTATLHNAGQSTIYNAQVNVTLPAHLTYAGSSTRWRLNSGAWNGPNAAYNPSSLNSHLVWTSAQIPGLAALNPTDILEIQFELVGECAFTGGDVAVVTQYENPCATVITSPAVATRVDVPSPEMGLTQGATAIADGGNFGFGIHAPGSNTDVVFTIVNSGTADLTLTTAITIGGAHADQFSIQAQPVSPVAASASTTFTVRYAPTSTGTKTATISIANSDSDESPYDLTLTGTDTGPTVTALVIDRTTPQTLYAAVDTAGVFRSSDGGQSWVSTIGQPGNLRVMQLALHPTVSGTLYAATYGGGVYTSSTSGNSWSACTNAAAGSLNALSLAIDATGKLYTGTEAGVYSSPDCATWNLKNTGLPNGTTTPVNVLLIAPAPPATLYAGAENAGIWKSGDSGASWTPAATQPTNRKVKALAINASGTTLYVGTDGGGVFKSSDSGVTWAACANTNLTNLNLRSLALSGTTLYAGTTAGVFTSTDDCASWSALNTGMP